MFVQDFVDAFRELNPFSFDGVPLAVPGEFDLKVPSDVSVFVRLLSDERCPRWVEDVSLPGVTVRDGFPGAKVSFVWHADKDCVLVKGVKKFSFKGKVFVNLTLRSLISVKPVLKSSLAVCDVCFENDGVVLHGVQDTVLFLQAVDLFDKLNIVFLTGELLTGRAADVTCPFSFSQFTDLALFEKRLFLLKELLVSDALKSKLVFMVDDLSKFDGFLQDAFDFVKRGDLVEVALMQYVRNLVIRDRHEVVKFKVTLKGPFSPSSMICTDGSIVKFVYYIDSNSPVETIFRACLVFAFDEVDGTYFLEAPKGVKVALEYLVKQYNKIYGSSKGSIEIKPINSKELTSVMGNENIPVTTAGITSDGVGVVTSVGFFSSVKQLFKNV